MRRSSRIVVILILAAALPAGAQEREVELYHLPQGPEPTTPGTFREPVSQAVGTVPGSIKEFRTTKIEKFSRWDRAGFTKRTRQRQFSLQQKLVGNAQKLAHVGRALGVINFLTDTVATVGGHLYEGYVQSATVAAVDEAAKGLSAAGGAWAFGKVGAGLGLMLGGPPGKLIGGAVGAVAGAVAVTLGYNAFVSSPLTDKADAVVDSVVKGYRALEEQERMRRQQREQMLGAMIAQILIQQAQQPPADETVDDQPPTDSEEVLLNLPTDFDVTYSEGVWSKCPWVFRFRGEQVTMDSRFTQEYPLPDGGKSVFTYHVQIKGTFRRGVLDAKYVSYSTGGHFGNGPVYSVGLYYRAWIWGTVSAQADSRTTDEGLLTVVIDINRHKHLDRLSPPNTDSHWGPWRDNTAMMEDPARVAAPWKPGREEIILKLPVGQLQASQKLAAERKLPAIPQPE